MKIKENKNMFAFVSGYIAIGALTMLTIWTLRNSAPICDPDSIRFDLGRKRSGKLQIKRP